MCLNYRRLDVVGPEMHVACCEDDDLCGTTKGKGVSFMENQVLWHYRTPKGDEFVRALAELEAS